MMRVYVYVGRVYVYVGRVGRGYDDLLTTDKNVNRVTTTTV